MLNKVLMLTAAALVTGTFALMPAANAQTATSTTEGAIVDFQDGPDNAAAAVLVEYIDGDVSALSASSAFGESGAAAAATADNALSVGSSEGVGSIREIESDDSSREEIFIDFGSSSNQTTDD